MFHDAFYLEIPAIAKAWRKAGWDEEKVRKLGDDVFGAIIRAKGHNWVARLYYSAVRKFGGAWRNWHWLLDKVLMALLLASLIGCCNGCLSIPDVFESGGRGGDVDEPQWERVEMEGGTP